MLLDWLYIGVCGWLHICAPVLFTLRHCRGLVLPAESDLLLVYSLPTMSVFGCKASTQLVVNFVAWSSAWNGCMVFVSECLNAVFDCRNVYLLVVMFAVGGIMHPLSVVAMPRDASCAVFEVGHPIHVVWSD